MTLHYSEEMELASQLVSNALLQDIEGVLEAGLALDKAVQGILWEMGNRITEQVYAGVNQHLSAQ